MNVSAINLTSFPKINSKTKAVNNTNKEVNQTQLSNYPRPYIPNFGQKQPQEFDISTLPNIGLNEEFSKTELAHQREVWI